MKAVDIRKGKTIIYEGEIYAAHEAQHVAKGNKRSYMQVKLKSVKSGQMIDVRFRVGDQVEVPFMESKVYEYLYKEGEHLVLMDTTDYEQVHVDGALFGDALQFLKANEKVSCQLSDGQILTAELPHVVVLKIEDTPPVVKGATVTNQPKDAILETGARVRVPAFIEPGELIRVDTRSGEYMERAK